MDTHTIRIAVLATMGAICLAARAADRPERSAYPFTAAVTEPGTYEASTTGTNFVLSGTITGEVAIVATEACRVTLHDLDIAGVLAITGNATLWLVGDNSIATAEASAITCTGTLTIGGPGTLTASAPGGKKTGAIAGVDLVLAGGATTLTIDTPTAKNASGVSLSGNYTQLAGTLKIAGASDAVKQNGVFLSKKKMKAPAASSMWEARSSTPTGSSFTRLVSRSRRSPSANWGCSRLSRRIRARS